MSTQQRLLSEADAAVYLGATQRQVRDLRYRRELPFVKVGRLVRIDVKALDRYITANTVAS